jgi:acetylornithine deacetylase
VPPHADIAFNVINAYPGLDTPLDDAVVEMLAGLTGSDQRIKVAFGTEGGLFSQKLGIPAVVCGPGSMAQGHKADEFVTLAQLDAVMRCLRRWLTGWNMVLGDQIYRSPGTP